MRGPVARRATGYSILAGALLVATLACSTAAATPPLPATPAVPTPPAPAVPNPAAPGSRDPAGAAGCHPSTELLGPDLADPSTARPTTGAAGSGCSWSGPSSAGRGPAFLLRADVRATGLAETHRARDLFRAFRTGALDGFPTVVTTPEGDPSCSLHVATSDHTSLTVQVGPAGEPVPDPCATATRAASRLLTAHPR